VKTFSPLMTVTGRVESVTSAQHTGTRNGKTDPTVALDLGDGREITLSYDPGQEAFSGAQIVRVTYTKWDNRIRAIHSAAFPDLDVPVDENAAYRRTRNMFILFGAVVAIGCFIASARKGARTSRSELADAHAKVKGARP
jgi:hypothetical protein